MSKSPTHIYDKETANFGRLMAKVDALTEAEAKGVLKNILDDMFGFDVPGDDNDDDEVRGVDENNEWSADTLDEINASITSPIFLRPEKDEDDGCDVDWENA